MYYPEIARKIIDLKNADLAFRDKLIEQGKLGDGYNDEMAAIHNSNADALEEIIDQVGYPTVDKVGEEASDAAWLVVQHSIGRPAFMRKCAVLLHDAVDENKANTLHLAYLEDRIAVLEGRKQLYKTQFDWNQSGELSAQPFDDLYKVNQRRKSLGLNSLEEQTHIMRSRAAKENQSPPENLEQRKQEMDTWMEKVGWIIVS